MFSPNYIKFECIRSCSACCKLSGGLVFVSEREAGAIASYLGISEAEFIDRYTRIEENKYCLIDGEEQNCIFLEPPHCRIYSFRPQQCRTYPFWAENLKNEERWRIICKECPGIGKGHKYTSEDIKNILNGRSLDSEK